MILVYKIDINGKGSSTTGYGLHGYRHVFFHFLKVTVVVIFLLLCFFYMGRLWQC